MRWQENNINPHSPSLAGSFSSIKRTERSGSSDPAAPTQKFAELTPRPVLVPIRILEDASRPGETFKSLAMALGAHLGGSHRVLGLIPAAAALELKDSHTADIASKRIVRHNCPLDSKRSMLIDMLTLLLFRSYAVHWRGREGVVAMAMPASGGRSNPLGISDLSRLLTGVRKRRRTRPSRCVVTIRQFCVKVSYTGQSVLWFGLGTFHLILPKFTLQCAH